MKIIMNYFRLIFLVSVISTCTALTDCSLKKELVKTYDGEWRESKSVALVSVPCITEAVGRTVDDSEMRRC